MIYEDTSKLCEIKMVLGVDTIAQTALTSKYIQ